MALDEEKKNFFQLLDTKSALLLGVVGGVLVLGTIGFIVLGSLALKNKGSVKPPSSPAVNVATNDTPAPIVVKSDRPKVELFVMAYCPYGLQMEKAYLPAWELLKNKADISVKFVSYAMHGKKEMDENTRQYCIQTEQSGKYAAYLQCFFSAGQNDGTEANYQQCLDQAGVNQSALGNCVAKTDKKFGITAKFNDQSSWLSGQYPLYPVNDELNNKYGVQGSPTLVINGSEVKAGRTPEAVKAAICASFDNPPAECEQKLSSAALAPGFGLAVAGGGANEAACGN